MSRKKQKVEETPPTRAEVVQGLRQRLAEAFSYACAGRHDPALDAHDARAWRKHASTIGDLIAALNEADDAHAKGKVPRS